MAQEFMDYVREARQYMRDREFDHARRAYKDAAQILAFEEEVGLEALHMGVISPSALYRDEISPSLVILEKSRGLDETTEQAKGELAAAEKQMASLAGYSQESTGVRAVFVGMKNLFHSEKEKLKTYNARLPGLWEEIITEAHQA